jgi:CelD/BcsL family acetyltransferase involved in cellulose biosynthesis
MATGLVISTDYADFPAVTNQRSSWGEGIARGLEKIPGWDVIRLSHVLEDSNAYALFEILRARGHATIVVDRAHCPYFDLDFENVDAFIRTKPRRFRENLMRRVRNINKECDIRYESDVTAGNWELLFDNLVRLHNIRKEAKGITGKFGDPQYARFHRDAFRSYASSGHLIAPRLLDGEKIIAITYAYIDKGVYYGYQTGMDPAYRVFSPGEVLTYYIVDDLKKRGIRRFDFMRGDEKYKYNWSTGESVLKDLLVFRNTPRSLLIFGYMKGMKRLRESGFVGRVRGYFGRGNQNSAAKEEKAGEGSGN